MKENKRWLKKYWFGAMIQILIISFLRLLLKVFDISYPRILDIVFIVTGGASTAIWGVIVARKSNKVDSYKKIFFDFFRIKQPIKYYLIIIMFIIIVFGNAIFAGKLVEGVKWYSFISIFMMAIIFGGIEEIGWRYTFQPLLERKLSYEASTLITFLSWGMWHYMYFYISDSLERVSHHSFLVGLLVSSFILGAIYHITQSLWLCVLYHCLFNTFSQTLVSNTGIWNGVSSILSIVLAIIIVGRYDVIEGKKGHEEN